MKRNIKPNIDEYDLDYKEKFNNPNVGAVELSDDIEERLENSPKNEKRKLWKKQTNELIDLFNNRFGKIYNRIR